MTSYFAPISPLSNSAPFIWPIRGTGSHVSTTSYTYILLGEHFGQTKGDDRCFLLNDLRSPNNPLDAMCNHSLQIYSTKSIFVCV